MPFLASVGKAISPFISFAVALPVLSLLQIQDRLNQFSRAWIELLELKPAGDENVVFRSILIFSSF
jgi:hypothetical protein